MNIDNLNYFEVCGGSGGLSLGFEKACEEINIKHNHYCLEIGTPQIKTLKRNRIGKWGIFQYDMTKFVSDWEIEYFLQQNNIPKNIDILAGGVPCQSFSINGKRDGFDNPRGELIFYFINLAKYLKPKILVVENVEFLTRINDGVILNVFLNLFKNAGYVPYWKVLNANDFNVAQNRKRVFFVCIRNDLHTKTFNYPSELEYKPVIRDILEQINNNKNKFNYYPLIESVKLALQRRIDPLKRLSLDKPSPTITTRIDMVNQAYVHWKEDRFISIKEAAAIQSYPEDYIFEGNDYEKYLQIGNSVPINLAYHLYKQLLNYYKEM